LWNWLGKDRAGVAGGGKASNRRIVRPRRAASQDDSGLPTDGKPRFTGISPIGAAIGTIFKILPKSSGADA